MAVVCPSALIGTAGAGAAPMARTPVPQRQIARAVSALAPLPSVDKGRPYLQGYDPAMRLALLGAADGAGIERATVHVGRAAFGPISRTLMEATVPVSISARGTTGTAGVVVQFSAVVIDVHGHWQLSWTSQCLLVERAGDLCPSTPKGLVVGDTLPALLGPADLAPGLVDPGPLAAMPGGGVLIADHGRNQILLFKDGVLRVMAGDGLEGFSGDGGPAADAELNDPGQMAVGPNGTVDFVDAGNHRIRAIALDGVITTVAGNGDVGIGSDIGDGGPATRVPLNPSGVAVGPTGTLFISADSTIRVVEPDGIISTRVKGGAPYGNDVPIGGVPTAFYPDSLALNGQGQLIVFLSSPKQLVAISPAGVVTPVATDYATALAPGPDGTVLVAQHGPSLGHTVGTTFSTLIDYTKVSVPGLRFSLSPDGVAAATDGTIYVDTEPGDGFNDQVGLYSIVNNHTTPVAIQSLSGATLPGTGAPGFAADLYPAPIAPQLVGAAMDGCPSMQGVVPFTPVAEKEARQLVGYWNTGFSYDLHASDRAGWPGVLSTFTGEQFGGRMALVSLGPAARDLNAAPLRAACGATLARDSIAIVLGPSPYSRSVEHLFLLDRDGTPLVYFAAA
jgi:hypothetical protein